MWQRLNSFKWNKQNLNRGSNSLNSASGRINISNLKTNWAKAVKNHWSTSSATLYRNNEKLPRHLTLKNVKPYFIKFCQLRTKLTWFISGTLRINDNHNLNSLIQFYQSNPDDIKGAFRRDFMWQIKEGHVRLTTVPFVFSIMWVFLCLFFYGFPAVRNVQVTLYRETRI